MDLFYNLLLLLNFIKVQADNDTATSLCGMPYGFTPRRSFKDFLLTSPACPNESPLPSVPTNRTVNLTTSEKPPNGNCTNNLTNPHSITSPSPPSEPPPDEPSKQPIVSFDEWTKEKLKQEQRKIPPAVTTPAPAAGTPTPTRNYASRECGAKILMTNPEAENTKAILNDKEKDEYMRNPCVKAENKFIVLELCETVQPREIVLANFELFSSSPKDIRVFTAERPGADWEPLSNFTASDTRNLQTFTIEATQYAKLLKIELLSHYGNEHYCTLSVLKVMGSSMVDEYEYEANQVESVRLPVQLDETTTIPPPPPTVKIPRPVPEPTTTPLPPVSTSSEPPIASTESAPTTQPKAEQKPIVREIVEQVVSGKIIKDIVNVVATKFTGKKNDQKTKKIKSFDMTLCHVCPIKPTCIVPTHLCWVFVWRPPPRNSTIPMDSLVLPNRRWISEKRRRRNIAFHQRQLHQHRDFVVPIEIKTAESNSDVVAAAAVEEDNKTEEIIQEVSPPTKPLTAEAIPATSMSHKESIFMKLNKRIAALELNMSLSSEYLSELSRQYVDGHQKHLEQARKSAEKVAEGVESRLNKTISERLSLMRKEMDYLSQWLRTIRNEASGLSLMRYMYQMPEKDRCRNDHMSDLHQYIEGPEDSSKHIFWTIEEVAIVVILAQIITIILVGSLTCYFCSRKPNVMDSNEMERLIHQKVHEILRKQSSMALPSSNAAPVIVPKKKRRKRNRLAAEPEPYQSDSAVSRTTTCPTETSSEAESARIQAEKSLNATIRLSYEQEKSEEEQPWIPVRRKHSLH